MLLSDRNHPINISCLLVHPLRPLRLLLAPVLAPVALVEVAHPQAPTPYRPRVSKWRQAVSSTCPRAPSSKFSLVTTGARGLGCSLLSYNSMKSTPSSFTPHFRPESTQTIGLLFRRRPRRTCGCTARRTCTQLWSWTSNFLHSRRNTSSLEIHTAVLVALQSSIFGSSSRRCGWTTVPHSPLSSRNLTKLASSFLMPAWVYLTSSIV